MVAAPAIVPSVQVQYSTVDRQLNFFLFYYQRAEIPPEGSNERNIQLDATPENVINQLPEQDVNHNNDVLHAAIDSAASPTIPDDDSINFTGQYIFSTHSAPPIFPALYVVITPELKVYNEPLMNSDVQRSLKMV